MFPYWRRDVCSPARVDMNTSAQNGTATCECWLDGAVTVVLELEKLADSLRNANAMVLQLRFHSAGETWALLTFTIVMATVISAYFFVIFSVVRHEFSRYWKEYRVALYCLELYDGLAQRLDLQVVINIDDHNDTRQVEAFKGPDPRQSWTHVLKRAYKSGFHEKEDQRLEEHLLGNDVFLAFSRHVRDVQQAAVPLPNEQGVWWPQLRDGSLNHMHYNPSVYPNAFFPSDETVQGGAPRHIPGNSDAMALQNQLRLVGDPCPAGAHFVYALHCPVQVFNRLGGADPGSIGYVNEFLYPQHAPFGYSNNGAVI
eukprot:597330-Rhodomonas_salina.1